MPLAHTPPPPIQPPPPPLSTQPTILLIPPPNAPTTIYTVLLSHLRARNLRGVVATRGAFASVEDAPLLQRRLLEPLGARVGRVLVVGTGAGAGLAGWCATVDGVSGVLVVAGTFGGVDVDSSDGSGVVAETHGDQKTGNIESSDLRGEEVKRSVPKVYVRAVRDSEDALQAQARAIHQAGAEWEIVDIEASVAAHDTAPEAVACLVERYARDWTD